MYFQPEYGNPDGSPGVYRPEGYVLKKPRTPDPSEMVREEPRPRGYSRQKPRTPDPSKIVREDNSTDKITKFQALLNRLQSIQSR